MANVTLYYKNANGTVSTNVVPSGDASFWQSQGWSATAPSAAPAPAASSSPAPAASTTTAQKATLYGPNGQATVVDVGSGQAANLQSQGWGLTPGSYKAPASSTGSPAPAPTGSAGTVSGGYTFDSLANWYSNANRGNSHVSFYNPSTGQVYSLYNNRTYGSLAEYRADQKVDPNNLGTIDVTTVDLSKPDAGIGAPAKATPAASGAPAPSASGDGTTGSGTSVDQSGWTQAMKDAYNATKGYYDLITSQGKTINPNVTIDQSTIDRFMAQAKTELDPYYKPMFDQASADLSKSVNRSIQDFGTGVKTLEGQYGQALESTQDSYARRGLAFSSERSKAEKLLADRATQGLEGLQRTTTRNAEDAASAAASTYGSRNLPSSFSFDTGAAPILDKPGVYGFTPSSTRSTLALTPTGITGSQERQRTYDEAARVNELTANERNLRALNTA